MTPDRWREDCRPSSHVYHLGIDSGSGLMAGWLCSPPINQLVVDLIIQFVVSYVCLFCLIIVLIIVALPND